jgi:chromosome segregation ATPase
MVTEEIRYLDNQAKRLVLGHAIEIGRRLEEAKALVPYGEWGNYIRDQLNYSQSTAQNFMRIFDEYGAAQQSLFGPVAESQALGNLSYTKALALLAVPREERETFAAEVDAEHISSRELAEAIRERDEARKKAAALAQELEGSQLAIAEAEEQRDAAIDKLMGLNESTKEQMAEDRDTIRTLEAKITELESRPIDVAVQEPDPEEVEKRAAELANKAKEELEQKAAKEVGAAEEKAAKAAEALKKAQEKAKAEREKLEAQLKEAEGKLAAAGEADKAEADKLRAEAEQLKKQLAMSNQATVVFKLRFMAWQQAHQQMSEAFTALDEETKEKMRAAIRAQVKNWGWTDE